MALTRFHYSQAYCTCFLEGFAAGFGEAEAGGGGRGGGRHEHLASRSLLRRRGGVGAGGGGGGRRRDERRRGGARGRRAVVVQRPGHVDAEVQPQRHLGLPPSALHPTQPTNQQTNCYH